ncbi:MAG: Asp-tRNA(Asn)/Glu-tRNA(Gln) amidotransferase subunit GatC [Candidatus Omnitrophica bacterium]|nr:Asp-tRNA(Asn)/Glu-tRNA(Gln) amidotransferase subunit GatC [Candidatus Omnitrophota bacterium]
MAIVSTQDVRQVALLARLALHDDELKKLAAQLDEILEYVRQLQAVSTDGVEPTSHVLPLADVTRPDQRLPSLPPEEALTLAPARHGHLVKVPKVID